jgi:uncharacterized membrane protein YbhN (UPF0104 family)
MGERGMLWLLGGSMLVLAAISAALFWGMTSGGLASAFGRALGRLPSRRLGAWVASRRQAWERADRLLATPVARQRLGKLVAPGALMLLQWFLEAAETWIILRLLGVAVSPVGALTIEVCASLIRSAAFAVPGGLGVQDAGYVTLLGAFGVAAAPTVGAGFVLVKRCKELVWIAVGYLVLLGWGAKARPPRATVIEAEQA